MRARATGVVIAMMAALLAPAGAALAEHGVCNGQHITIDSRNGQLGTEIDGTAGDDVIAGGGSPETINGLGGNDHICGGDGNDVIDGGAGHDEMYGDAGNDDITGGADPVDCDETSSCGNDLLVGLAGNDTLTGGSGRDTTYYYDAPVPTEEGVLFAVDLDLTRSAGEAITTIGTDQLAGIEDVYGSPHNDKLVGDAANNYLDGDPGEDIVRGGAGDDIVIGDRIDMPFKDKLYGGPGNDHHWGLGGNDIMADPSGTNRFAGDQGNDTITGGNGFDYVDYYCRAFDNFCQGDVKSGQLVDLRSGTARPVVTDTNPTNDHGTDTLIGEIEGVRGSKFRDVMRGRDNVQDIDEFGDYFWPEGGNDSIDGRGGPDYVDYDVDADDLDEDCSNPVSANVGLTLTLLSDGAGAATTPEVTSTNYLGNDQLANIEHAIGSPRRDTMTGTAASNQMWGGCGNDVVNGGGGNDHLAGDDQNDVVNGNSGDDRMTGGDGDDTLRGGFGHDLVSYDGLAAAPGVEVHLAGGTALGEGQDSILSTEVVIGSDFGDRLVGGPAAEVLIGGAGEDELWGRDGADVLVGNGVEQRDLAAPADGADGMFGGAGTDTVDYSGAEAAVDVDLSAQTATEGSVPDHVSGIEVVQGSDHDDILRGDAVANRLLGGNGGDMLDGEGANDYIDGQGGSDVMRGGGGAADVVDFGYPAEANTRVELEAGDAFVRNANTDPTNETIQGVEVVAGTTGRDALWGTSRADYLAGGGGNDALFGLGDNDFLFGQSGTDTFAGGSGAGICHKGSGESTTSCETKATGTPGWYVRITGPREFRADGTDDFLNNLDIIVEELRRHHYRRHHY